MYIVHTNRFYSLQKKGENLVSTHGCGNEMFLLSKNVKFPELTEELKRKETFWLCHLLDRGLPPLTSTMHTLQK